MSVGDSGRRRARRPRPPRLADSAGWIALTSLTAGGVALVIALVMVATTADVLRTAATAQTAADAAALAAAGASPLVGGAGDARRQAERMATRNGAELSRCDCGALDAAGVSVTAEPRLALVRLALPRVHARSRAELRAADDP